MLRVPRSCASFVGLVLAMTACSSSAGDGGGSEANGGTGTSGGTSGTMPFPATCDTDPLRTGITAQQTGVSADAFDCQILRIAAKYSEPDPMIFKAIMYHESRFDRTAAACPNLPCGMPDGWTAEESGCYGLMQVVPACGKPGDLGMLPSGHPNLTKDPSGADWAGSVFNPEVNIDLGIKGVSGNRAQEVAKFPGCTVDQYTMMAIGDYGSYGSTKSCTEWNHSYIDMLLETYEKYAAAASYTPHAYGGR